MCVIDIFSKYAWLVPLKYKKGVGIANAFQKILNDSIKLESKSSEANSREHKPNKIWVDKGIEFYNNSSKKWLKDSDIEMYLTHNGGKYVVAERFIRTLKTKTCKYITSLSKNVSVDKLDDKINEYNNTNYRR